MTQSNNPIQNELMHYGILGQKWGVRRDRGPDGTVGGGKKPSNRAIKKERKKTSAMRRHLSDGELKKAVDRLQTEKKLKDLTKEDIAPGKTAASSILKQIGKASLVAAGTAVATYSFKAAMEGKLNPASSEFWNEAGKFIRPKK